MYGANIYEIILNKILYAAVTVIFFDNYSGQIYHPSL
jgi:hypothetical protein